jgi:hypothetical protein
VPQLSASPLGCRSKGGNTMWKLYILFLLGIMPVVAQMSNRNFNIVTSTGSDSLVDVFPLAIGNQWIYRYDWSSYDDIYSYSDTGTVSIRIIDRIIGNDSTQWIIQETNNLRFRFLPSDSSGSLAYIDTIELIEQHQDRHRLYRIGDNNKITQSVFPFLPLVDTMVYRYEVVNAEGIKAFTSRNGSGKGVFKFSFKQDIGLSSISGYDGCTCMSGFSANHSLQSQIITGVANSHERLLSRSYYLNQNYPNPFNPSTTISFILPLRSFISLKVFDLVGREVVTIASEEMQAGSYSRQWNASGLPSGIYFYRLQAGSFTETKKLILLK